MRLLIIGINYLPEQTGIGPYTSALATYLVEQGHEVEVLTGLPSYPEWKVHAGYRRVIRRTENHSKVRVHRRWHYVPSSQTALRRLAYEASFLLTGLSFVRFPRPDLVLGIIPSLSGGLLAQLAARHFKVPFALIFQDLMGPAAAQTGVSGANKVASLVKSAERAIAVRAATVGIIAEGFRDYMEGLGVPAERIIRVRNWTRVSAPTEGREVTRHRLGLPDESLVCLHAGNMGHKQALENVIECARMADLAGARLHFILMGDGNQRSELERLALSYRLTNLEFLPLQPERDFANLLAAADILLLNQRAGVSEMALPSKLTAYLAASRPIVAAVEQGSETYL
jgi:colanic acid biosynthesis glycosyl transferase WcaI